jgi:hypothetical protein
MTLRAEFVDNLPEEQQAVSSLHFSTVKTGGCSYRLSGGLFSSSGGDYFPDGAKSAMQEKWKLLVAPLDKLM